MVHLLASQGADLNAQAVFAGREAGEFGYTPLQGALLRASYQDMAPVHALLEAGADPAIPDADGYGSLCRGGRASGAGGLRGNGLFGGVLPGRAAHLVFA